MISATQLVPQLWPKRHIWDCAGRKWLTKMWSLLSLIERSPEEWPDGTCALNRSIWKMQSFNHSHVHLRLQAYIVRCEGLWMFGILLQAAPHQSLVRRILWETNINRIAPSLSTPSGILGGSNAPYDCCQYQRSSIGVGTHSLM
jgi:hypothetical protein